MKTANRTGTSDEKQERGGRTPPVTGRRRPTAPLLTRGRLLVLARCPLSPLQGSGLGAAEQVQLHRAVGRFVALQRVVQRQQQSLGREEVQDQPLRHRDLLLAHLE